MASDKPTNLERRRFIKNAAIVTATVPLSADFFLLGCATKADIPADEFRSLISYEFHLLRTLDFTNLKFYFVNLRKEGKFLKKKLASKDSYMIVRLPPQHIAEQTFNAYPDHNVTGRSSIAGFSHLTFKLKYKKTLNLDEGEYLDWDLFELITLKDLVSYQNKPVDLTGDDRYPLSLDGVKGSTNANIPKELLNQDRVPVTLIEAPYKMYLTPVVHQGPLYENAHNHFNFTGDNRGSVLWKDKGEKNKLHEIWNSGIEFSIENDFEGHYSKAPSFKVIAFEETNPGVDKASHEQYLLPSPHEEFKDRSRLAKLTNLPGYGRNVNSQYFNLSTLGVSTFLNYENFDDQNTALVAWKQDIKLGRDNYVEIVELGVCARTGLKVLVSRIAERRLDNGVSYLWSRMKFAYLEHEKHYTHEANARRHSFKTIRPLKAGSFYNPGKSKKPTRYHQVLKENDPTIKAEKGPGSKPNPLTGVEYNQEKAIGDFDMFDIKKDRVLKMPYVGIDHDGNEQYFDMDVFIIFKTAYLGDDWREVLGDALDHHNDIVSPRQKALTDEKSRIKEYLKIRFDKRKIGYASSTSQSEVVGNSGTEKSNASLSTDYLQFSFHYDFDPSDRNANKPDFDGEHPIIPYLMYAKVAFPQLEGIDTSPKTYHVCYSKDYVEHGFSEEQNASKVFLRTLPTSIESALGKSKNALADKSEIVVNDLHFELPPHKIGGIFKENYKNAGGMVDPDIVIEGVSILKQSITMTENLNGAVDDISTLRPNDVLRGLNAEILGGISLKDILSEVLPIEDVPIFNVLEQAQQGLELVDEFKGEYEKIKKQVIELPKQIDRLKKDAKNALNDEVKKRIDSFGNTLKQYYQLNQLLSAVINKKKYIEERYEKRRFAVQQYTEKIKNSITDVQIDVELRGFKDKKNLRKCIEEVSAKFIELQNQYIVLLQTAAKEAESGKVWIPDMQPILTRYESLGIVIESLNSELQRLGESNALAQLEVVLTANHQNVIFTMLGDYIKNTNLQTLEYLKKLTQQNATFLSAQENTDVSEYLKVTKPTEEIYRQALSLFMQSIQNFGEQLQGSSRIFFNSHIGHMRSVYGLTRFYAGHLVDELYKEKQRFVKSFFKGLETELLCAEFLIQLQTIYQFVRDAEQEFVALKNEYNLVRAWATDLPENSVDVDTLRYDIQEQVNVDLFNLKERFEQQLQNELKDHPLVKEVGNRIKSAREYVALTERSFIELRNHVKNIEEDLQKTWFTLIDVENKIKQDYIAKIKERESKLAQVKRRAENFIEEKLNDLESELRERNRELLAAYDKTESDVKRVQRRITEIRQYIQQIKAIDKKTVEYSWSTEDFKSNSFGIVSFGTKNYPKTALTIDVKSTINFDLSKVPQRAPAFDSVEVETLNRLENFDITFLDIITISFAEVSFHSKTGEKEEFKVDIDDVSFTGALNFVQVLQQFMQSLDKNLTLDISAKGVELGYLLPIPDVSGGAFNLVNMKLAMGFVLPFQSGNPMRFNFGVNSPKDMFLVSVSIFGGRGCFRLDLEPKRGVVGALLIIEFGGVLYLNIGVAKGMIYLFAGIYIRRELENVEIRGYLVCGGSMSILGLVTASITFYMGLHGNGDYLDGHASASYSFKIAFKKFRVGMSVYKRIDGARDESANSANANSAASALTRGNLDNKDDCANTIYRIDHKENSEGGQYKTPLTSKARISKRQWSNYLDSYHTDVQFKN